MRFSRGYVVHRCYVEILWSYIGKYQGMEKTMETSVPGFFDETATWLRN